MYAIGGEHERIYPFRHNKIKKSRIQDLQAGIGSHYEQRKCFSLRTDQGSFSRGRLGSTIQVIHALHDTGYPVYAYGIINEFPIPLRLNDTSTAQYGKMLGCYRLLQPEMYVDLSDGDLLLLIDQLHNLLAKPVIKSPKNQRRLFEIGKINLNGLTLRIESH